MEGKDNLNSIEFDKPDKRTGIIKWMWWLYVVTGLFIVCLLIWMFVALSKHQTDEQQYENAIENVQPAVQY